MDAIARTVQYHALMDASQSIGLVIRQLRGERGWTLDHAATRLGISRRLLAQLEAGAANPSLSTLVSIAHGFGVDLVDLVDLGSDASTSPDHVVQCDNASADLLWSTDSGGEGRFLVGLGPLEMWSWTLAPGDMRRSEAHRGESREALVVLDGQVEIDLGADVSVSVEAGQSMAFRADTPHVYRNSGSRTARFHLAVFDPVETST